MPEIDADILIVGAGLAGATTAYHLAQSQDRRVIILEKEATAGQHASGRNAAFVREWAKDAAIQSMLTRGAETLRKGELAEYARCGSMLIGLGEDDVREHFPLARGRGRWCPGDGTLDVAGLLQAYLAGQTVHYETEVLAWERAGGRFQVRTNRQAYTCETLVNAAGPWAGALGRLPLQPMKRHLFVTTPMQQIDPRWPFVWDLENGLYFRPESGGLLLSACDEAPADPGDYAEAPEVLEDLGRKLTALQPELSGVSIQSSWAGQRSFAPDRRFVVGFDPRHEKLFHVAGLGGHGVTASPAIGRLAAALILNKPVADSEPFSPQRLREP